MCYKFLKLVGFPDGKFENLLVDWEPERAKMAATPPIFASDVEFYFRNGRKARSLLCRAEQKPGGLDFEGLGCQPDGLPAGADGTGEGWGG